jgi:hypothetical protein
MLLNCSKILFFVIFSRVPPVLKDMTNIPRAQGEKSPVKKPG